MNVYALDSSNIDSFEHLADPISAEAVRSGAAHGFCVKTDDCHAGALIGRFTDTGEYEILSLYVLPEYRRQGVGELLLDTLAEMIGEYDANVSITFIARSEEDKELMFRNNYPATIGTEGRSMNPTITPTNGVAERLATLSIPKNKFAVR